MKKSLKKIAVLTLAMSMMPFANVNANASGYFNDPSFDDPNDTQFEWTSTQKPNAITRSYAKVTTNDGANDNVMKFVSTDSSNNRIKLNNLTPETEYTLTFTAMSEATDLKTRVAIIGFATGDLSGSDSTGVDITNEWKEYTVKFKTGPSISEVVFNIWNKESTTSYLDDLNLVGGSIGGGATTTETSNAPVNYFTDPSFDDKDNSQLEWKSTQNGSAITRSYDKVTTDSGANDNVLKFVSTDSSNNRFEIKDLSPETEYEIKFKSMSEEKTTKSRIAIVGYETGDLTGPESIGVDVPNEWKESSIKFKTGPSITTVTFNIWNKVATTTYLDDFELIISGNEEVVKTEVVVGENGISGLAPSANGKTVTDASHDLPTEVLIENPELLPMSDPENTLNWKFSETMSDEFDSEVLDTTKWIDGKVGWVGRAPAYYKTGNSFVDDGMLVLRSDWTDEVMDVEDGRALPGDPIFDAASITSVLYGGYGYYEISSRTSLISLTSAFWMRNNTGDEIDVFEQVGGSKLNPSHTTKYPMNTHRMVDGKDSATPMTYETNTDLTQSYNVYGLDYGPEYIKFYFNGELVNFIENPGIHTTMPIRLDTEAFVWHGYPDKEDFKVIDNNGEERYTGDFHVDYVRVWRTTEAQTEEVAEEVIVDYKETQAVYGTPAAITADFAIDPVWNNANSLAEYNIVMGGVEKFDVSMDAKTMWDDNYLYVLANVDDNSFYMSEDDTAPHNGDCLDIYFDFGNEKQTDAYDSNDFNVKVMPDGRLIPHANAPAGITCSGGIGLDGYVVQLAIPLSSLNIVPNETVIGFDIQINEGNTTDKQRVGTLVWSSTQDNLFKIPFTIGNLKFTK